MKKLKAPQVAPVSPEATEGGVERVDGAAHDDEPSVYYV